MNSVHTEFFKHLRLPVIQAPMFLVSTPELLIEAAKSGIVGTLPSQNARTTQVLDEWLSRIKTELKEYPQVKWGINVITHNSFTRSEKDIEVIVKHRVPLVISALGSPKSLVEKVHSYQGLVFADVVNMVYAKKSAKANVDGLILVSTGAGGHTGALSPFAFVNEVRQFFKGIVVVGGAISKGSDVLALQAMGADLAYMGTRFIATKEGGATEDYQQMLIDCGIDDIALSNKVTGVDANWIKPSLEKSQPGISVTTMIAAVLMKHPLMKKLFKKKLSFKLLDSAETKKRWRDIYSAGQGIGSIDKVCSVGELVDELEQQYNQSLVNINEIRSS